MSLSDEIRYDAERVKISTIGVENMSDDVFKVLCSYKALGLNVKEYLCEMTLSQLQLLMLFVAEAEESC
jgi:hypothetical protein